MRSVDDDTGSSYNDPAVPVCYATEESSASTSVTLPCVTLVPTSVSNLTSVVTHATEPDPQRHIPLLTTPPIFLAPSPPVQNPLQSIVPVMLSTLLARFFPEVDISKVHRHDLCQEKTHCNLSGSKFKHEWLSLKAKSGGKSKNNNSALDVNAGLW